MKEVQCPSGAVLQITPSSFGIAKNLFQAFLGELKDMKIDSKTELTSIYKEMFCAGIVSETIEKCLWVCFERCTYDSGQGALKIDKTTFEPVETRQDYLTVCMEVGKENILPFTKNLLSECQRILGEININIQK